MPTLLDPGDPRNYTIGGTRLSLNGDDLGNIVSCVVTPEVEPLDLYRADMGYAVPDLEEDAVVSAASLTLDVLLDELTVAAFNLFLGGQDSPVDGKLAVLRRASIVGTLVLTGVSVYGVSYEYTIPKARIAAGGGMTYSSESWTTLPLRVTVYPSTDEPDSAFGTFEVIGVGP